MHTLKTGQSALLMLEGGECFRLTCIGEGGQHGRSRLACDACQRAGVTGRALTGFTQYGDLIAHIRVCKHVKGQDQGAASSSPDGAGAVRDGVPVHGGCAGADEAALLRLQLQAPHHTRTCGCPVDTFNALMHRRTARGPLTFSSLSCSMTASFFVCRGHRPKLTRLTSSAYSCRHIFPVKSELGLACLPPPCGIVVMNRLYLVPRVAPPPYVCLSTCWWQHPSLVHWAGGPG